MTIYEGLGGSIAYTVEGNTVYRGLSNDIAYTISGSTIYEGKGGSVAYKIDGKIIYRGLGNTIAYKIDGNYIYEGLGGNIAYKIDSSSSRRSADSARSESSSYSSYSGSSSSGYGGYSASSTSSSSSSEWPNHFGEGSELMNEIEKFGRMSRGEINIFGETLPQYETNQLQPYSPPPVPNPPSFKPTVTARDIQSSLGKSGSEVETLAEKLAKLKNERNYWQEQNSYWHIYGDRPDVLIHSAEWKTSQDNIAKAENEMRRIDAEIFDITNQIESIGAVPKNEVEISDTKARLAEGIKRAAKLRMCIDCGYNHIVGLKSNGTVIHEGRGGSESSKNWTNVIAVAAGNRFTIGIKTDGTVVGINSGRPESFNEIGNAISNWNDIKAISVSNFTVVGLKSNGTIVMYTPEEYSAKTRSWRDIILVSTSSRHTVGLKNDGTVVATGKDGTSEACNVSTWKDIVAISTGDDITVGLKADGTVVVAAHWLEIRTAVKSWVDIISVASGSSRIYGLKSDGTVVSTSEQSGINTSGWRDIVAITVGEASVLGLKSDGSIAVTGSTGYGYEDDARKYNANWQGIGLSNAEQVKNKKEQQQTSTLLEMAISFFCSNCGNSFSSHKAQFCGKCGTKRMI